MNTFRKHMPAFVDCDRPLPDIPFDTTEELLALPDIAVWKDDPKFSHYAISDHHLMGILDNGLEWWVIGSVANPATVNLPQWDGGRYSAILDGEVVTLTSEVVCSCGKTLTLRDGRTATNLRRLS